MFLGAACGSSAPVRPADAPVDPHAATSAALIPTSIGRGPEYQPSAHPPTTGCVAGAVAGRFRAHIELFGRRHAIVIPAAIGLAPPLRRESGRVVSARCRADMRTLDPSGVIQFDRGDLHLGDLFALWGEPLDGERMLSFRGPVSVFVNGRRVTGDPANVPLRDGAQIVVESGGYIPPHPSFRFPPRGAA
jgi:hypothetical protein